MQFKYRSCPFSTTVKGKKCRFNTPPSLLLWHTAKGKNTAIKDMKNFHYFKPQQTPFSYKHLHIFAVRIHPCNVLFPVEVNYKERRDVIGLLTINRHDVLFWLQPTRAVKKGDRPTARGVEGVVTRWYSPLDTGEETCCLKTHHTSIIYTRENIVNI